MTSAVRALRDVRMADAAKVGGKAASLGELLAAGVHVPDGVVLTAGAAALAPEDRESLLRTAGGMLEGGRFAVRSSGIAEDGAERSFAGMYESILDVAPDEVAAAAERILASASAGRLATYAPGGREAENAAVGVIVQRMVEPVAAGVALTADPVSGDRATSVVTAVRGLGDRLVSG